MSFNKTITLNDGNKIPQIGLGTWLSKPNEVENAVEAAVRDGYRHLDLAKIYCNQKEVARALKKVIPSVVKREDLFITSKLWNTAHKPENVLPALEDTLEELGVDYLDMYLIHWPVPLDPSSGELMPKENGYAKLDLETTLVDTWKAMIALKETGKVKSIGVSNFTIEYVDAIIKATGVTPATNQVELHPRLPQEDLLKHHKEKNILLTAYSPLGNNVKEEQKIVDYPQVAEIAKKRNLDPAQLLVAWGVRRGCSVIPKSVTPKRIKSNFEQIELTDDELESISNVIKAAGGHKRYNVPIAYDPPWDINVFNEDIEQKAKHKVHIQ